MISNDQNKIARENWIKASTRLKFRIICPYTIFVNGGDKEVFAFLPEYGSNNGIVVELISSPLFETDNEIIKWANANRCFYSFVNIENCLEYNENFFQETLIDWQNYQKEGDHEL